jgi:large subunit ribosomal protein L18
MDAVKNKNKKRKQRHARIRTGIFGTTSRPRLFVFRSSRHIYAQLVDDENGNVLASVSDAAMPVRRRKSKDSAKSEPIALKGKVDRAFAVGKALAAEGTRKGFINVVFDRGGYKYHGRVKAVAEGARIGGLHF